ncbi:winged helix-turn-helix domain-containing protein [Streptomyces phaeochromogenes]
MLAFLTAQPDVLVTRETIVASVWDANWFGPIKTLDTHVSALWHKFGDVLTIQAVRGAGFQPLHDNTSLGVMTLRPTPRCAPS